jgi:hypothetical protein
MTMNAPPTKLYDGPAEALALALDVAEPARLEAFLRALRARLTLTEPCHDRHPRLEIPTP